MLALTDIASFFPEEVRDRERGMLREYLQYLILSSIYTFDSLTRDLEPFLFRAEDLALVREFPLYIEKALKK